MKLQTRLYLFSTVLIVVTTFSVLLAGMAIINQLLYQMSRQVLNLEAGNVINQLDEAYQVLEESGLSGVKAYRDSVKNELSKKFSGNVIQKGTVIIIDEKGHCLTPTQRLSAPKSVIVGLLGKKSGELEFTDPKTKKNIYSIYDTSPAWKWTVIVSIPRNEMMLERDLYFLTVTFIGMIVLVIALSVSYFFSRRLSTQVSAIINTIKKVAMGDFSSRVTIKPFSKEHKELQTGINSMIDDLMRREVERSRVEEEFRKHQKLESIGVLAGGIAHDFNNLLTAIRGNVQLAQMYPMNKELEQCLTETEKATERAMDLTRQLLTFSKGGDPIKKSANIEKILEHAATFVLRGAKTKCEFAFDPNLKPVYVDPGQISQVIDNLVINANQAMPDGGIININAETVQVDQTSSLPFHPGEYVKITIQDHGTGIKENNLAKIFDPFFTTKKTGTGLGLSTCYTIVKRHEGHITVESEVGQGTTFIIYLPVAEEIIVPQAKRNKTEDTKIDSGKILLMDDQESIRVILEKMLKTMNCECECTAEGSQAVRAYVKALESGEPFDMVFMDLTIPGGMGGRETIEELLKVDPNVIAIVASGYSNDPVMAHYKDYGFKGKLEKPFKMEDLRKLLKELLRERKNNIAKAK